MFSTIFIQFFVLITWVLLIFLDFSILDDYIWTFLPLFIHFSIKVLLSAKFIFKLCSFMPLVIQITIIFFWKYLVIELDLSFLTNIILIIFISCILLSGDLFIQLLFHYLFISVLYPLVSVHIHLLHYIQFSILSVFLCLRNWFIFYVFNEFIFLVVENYYNNIWEILFSSPSILKVVKLTENKYQFYLIIMGLTIVWSHLMMYIVLDYFQSLFCFPLMLVYSIFL